ncbi:cation:proton antiporter [Roseomonas xinghualingensis]|uniref:cation:proton antiporter domain-containing protein n=1 Tax=Roseomonas xinghualingensis TaxID=2986475 RepID=UPI0021F21911|nr:cation:proton antiporter [Roseomonas sp. SXEYE001]MCV4205977.1 cation:proton antiporter [Roseomonas sp. SXEYE001]
MPETRFVALTIIAVALILALARMTRIPPSVLWFAGGLASILLPGPVPPLRVDPLIVLGLLLPPLLYAGVSSLSPSLLQRAAWRGVAMGAFWTLALTAACGYGAHLLLPGLDPVACMAIGVAAAIAEPRVLTESGLDKRLPPALGEALSAQLASAPLLGVSLSIFTAKSVGGPFPGLPAIAGTLAYDVFAGAGVGIALGFAMAHLRRRLDAPQAETALSLATPFAAAMIGEAIGASPIGPLIGAGLVIAWCHAKDEASGLCIASPESRQLTKDLWRALDAVLTGALFFLMGRALPEALAGAQSLPWLTLATAAIALMVLCWAVQFALSWAALAHPNSPPIPREGGGRVASWQGAALMAGGAGRSVVALAVALAVPITTPAGEPYLARDAVVAVVALMVVASAALQWVGVPGLVRWVRPGNEA